MHQHLQAKAAYNKGQTPQGNRMSPALKITGNHPAGLWLAHCLHQRGWRISWTAETLPEQLGIGAYHDGLAAYFGRENLCFPPEWCMARLAGVQPEQTAGTGLFSWPVSLLDLNAIWVDLLSTAPCVPLPDHTLTLFLGFAPCTQCPPGVSTATSSAPVPSGFLIQQASSWSVRLGKQQVLQMGPDEDSTAPSDPAQLRWCDCLPTLSQTHASQIVWLSPLPSLLPEAMLSQSMYWLLVQEVLAGLTDGSMQPQYLHAQWQACWQKVHQGLIMASKSQKFLPIPK